MIPPQVKRITKYWFHRPVNSSGSVSRGFDRIRTPNGVRPSAHPPVHTSISSPTTATTPTTTCHCGRHPPKLKGVSGSEASATFLAGKRASQVSAVWVRSAMEPHLRRLFLLRFGMTASLTMTVFLVVYGERLASRMILALESRGRELSCSPQIQLTYLGWTTSWEYVSDPPISASIVGSGWSRSCIVSYPFRWRRYNGIAA